MKDWFFITSIVVALAILHFNASTSIVLADGNNSGNNSNPVTPGFPHQFYGFVTINGKPAQDGLLVTARINNEDVAATITSNGGYGFESTFTVQGLQEGQTVHFFVQGFDTGESYTYDGNTTITRIDLTLSGELFCGDNVCAGSESCSSCPADCGSCPSSGGSSGGGGGGGSSHHGGGGSYYHQSNTNESQNQTQTNESLPEQGNESIIVKQCTPDWVCSDWLPCIGGVQKRVCVDANKCGVEEGKPLTERPCTEQEIKKTVEKQNVKQGFFNKLTGAVIGAGKASVAALIIAVLVVIAVLGFLFYKHKPKARVGKKKK